MSLEGYSEEDSFHLWCLKERSEGTFRRNVYMLFHLRLHLLSSEYSSLNLEVYISITFLHLFLLLKRILHILPYTHPFLRWCLPVSLFVCQPSCQPLNTSSMLLSFIILSVLSHIYSLLRYTFLFLAFHFFPSQLLIITTAITISIFHCRFFEVRFLLGIP